MYCAETHVRVRYGETDRMGYAYYGNYLLYYEVGRTEMLRQMGLTYKYMEDNGILLPVSDVRIKYSNPAMYDDLLRIKTIIKEMPKVRIRFEYEIYNESSLLINQGETTLVFVDKATRKPRRAPDFFLELLLPFFQH
jgi:acyl-CoA thioester hydrolase